MKKIALVVFLSIILGCSNSFATENQESIINIENSFTQEVAPDTVKIKFYVENSVILLFNWSLFKSIP